MPSSFQEREGDLQMGSPDCLKLLNSREAGFSLVHLTGTHNQLPILIRFREQQFTASQRSQIGAVMNYCNCLFYTLQ